MKNLYVYTEYGSDRLADTRVTISGSSDSSLKGNMTTDSVTIGPTPAGTLSDATSVIQQLFINA